MSDQNRDPYIPMPDTHHPVFTELTAEEVRKHSDKPGVTVMMSSSPANAYLAMEKNQDPLSMTKKVQLRRFCFRGPAPFVGNARLMHGAYIWYAYMDSLGRHISGPAELEMKYRTVPTHTI